MSWNTAKKRFQRDLDRYPKVVRDALVRKNNRFTLPTFENTHYVPSKERKTTLLEIGFADGDLAYIAEGPKKGTVLTIYNYLPQLDAVYLADLTSKKLLPKTNWVPNQTSHLMEYPDHIPRKNIRLAAKDKDENGKVYYVVAEDVVYKDRYYDDRYKKWLPRRFVKHHEALEIPWPNPPQEPKDDELSTAVDTVFEKTYEWQTLARAPFPAEVLGQLRNPHSSYKKKALSEADARRLNAPEMPLSREQKIYLAKKAAQPKKVLRRLSPEIQDFIGKRIADHIAKIDSPHMLAHLDALSQAPVPDFAKTMRQIEEEERQ